MCTWSIWEAIKAIGKRRQNVICEGKKIVACHPHIALLFFEVQTRIIGVVVTKCFFQFPFSCFRVLSFLFCYPSKPQVYTQPHTLTLLIKCAFKLTFWLLIDFFFADTLPGGCSDERIERKNFIDFSIFLRLCFFFLRHFGISKTKVFLFSVKLSWIPSYRSRKLRWSAQKRPENIFIERCRAFYSS